MGIYIVSGIIAAVLHVVSGPDHLAAVTPIAIEAKKKVWRIGFFWGLGHLIGMLLIGSLFLLFRELIPVEEISHYSEQLVAFVLIGLGFWVLYNLFIQEKIHERPHIHANKNVYIHTHKSQHVNSQHTVVITKNHITSLSVGIIHGLAGVSHFLLFLPALGFKSMSQSNQYLIGFAVGTILAMSLYTFILGSITKKSNNNHLIVNVIRLSGGVFAFAVGIYWLCLSF